MQFYISVTWWHVPYMKKNLHFCRWKRQYGRTDRRTDRPYDTDARTHLKTLKNGDFNRDRALSGSRGSALSITSPISFGKRTRRPRWKWMKEIWPLRRWKTWVVRDSFGRISRRRSLYIIRSIVVSDNLWVLKFYNCGIVTSRRDHEWADVLVT